MVIYPSWVYTEFSELEPVSVLFCQITAVYMLEERVGLSCWTVVFRHLALIWLSHELFQSTAVLETRARDMS